MDNKYGETPQQKIERATLNSFKRDIYINQHVCEMTGYDAPTVLYRTWQTQIAMAFVYAFNRYAQENEIQGSARNFNIQEIANTAAKNFLNNLCTQPKISENKKPNE